MAAWALELLHESSVLRLFLVVAAGYVLGELKFPGNFRLGIAAVLFAGLGFGMLDPKFILPVDLQNIGLVLFVYCVGLEAAPGFLQSLRKDGLRLNLSVAVALTFAFFALWAAILWSGRSRETLTGLFCAALTNTPALGAVTEWLTHSTGNPELVNRAVVGYGVAYPFAVLTILLMFQSRTGRRQASALKSYTPSSLPRAQTIEVRHLKGETPWMAGEVEEQAGLVLTRCKTSDGQVFLLSNESQLVPGSCVIAVGPPANLQQAINLLGAASPEPLEANLKGFETHRYFVSNSKLAGRTLGELGLEKLGAVVSRVRRGDVDLPVNDDTLLHLGDRVRVITYKENEPVIEKMFGNSLSALSETGYLSFALGIAIGILLGAIPIPIPGVGAPVRLGLAGGPLLAALILGSLGRTGPFIWNPPLTVSLTLRHVGLLFFLACVGVKAGTVLPATLREDGVFLIALAVAITVSTHLVLWILLSLPPASPVEKVLGTSAGLQTQPSALAFAAQRLPPATLNVAYATVYPLAIVLKILFAQLLLIIP